MDLVCISCSAFFLSSAQEFLEVERILSLPGFAGLGTKKPPKLELPRCDFESDDEDSGDCELDSKSDDALVDEKKAEPHLPDADDGVAERVRVECANCADTALAAAGARITVKWRALGYEHASDDLWRDVLEACEDREARSSRRVPKKETSPPLLRAAAPEPKRASRVSLSLSLSRAGPAALSAFARGRSTVLWNTATDCASSLSSRWERPDISDLCKKRNRRNFPHKARVT